MPTVKFFVVLFVFFFNVILNAITLLTTLELFPIFGYRMTKFYEVIWSNLISAEFYRNACTVCVK